MPHIRQSLSDFCEQRLQEVEKQLFPSLAGRGILLSIYWVLSKLKP